MPAKPQRPHGPIGTVDQPGAANIHTATSFLGESTGQAYNGANRWLAAHTAI